MYAWMWVCLCADFISIISLIAVVTTFSLALPYRGKPEHLLRQVVDTIGDNLVAA